MNTESDSSREEQWILLVRRSFGISDLVSAQDAREELIGSLQNQLHANGWRSPSRGIAEPMVDALMTLGANADWQGFPLEPDAALKLIDNGLAEIDPEHLAFDMRFAYPSEVVGAAQQVLDKIAIYVREQAGGE
jgi:hypothetical protein